MLAFAFVAAKLLLEVVLNDSFSIGWVAVRLPNREDHRLNNVVRRFELDMQRAVDNFITDGAVLLVFDILACCADIIDWLRMVLLWLDLRDIIN